MKVRRSRTLLHWRSKPLDHLRRRRACLRHRVGNRAAADDTGVRLVRGPVQRLQYQQQLRSHSVSDAVSECAVVAVPLHRPLRAGVYLPVCFGISGIRATRICREDFIKSLIRQDVAFLDSCSPGTVATTVSNNADLVENRGTEVGALVQAMSMFVAAFVVAFSRQ